MTETSHHVALARQALAQGDLMHAGLHISEGLAIASDDPELVGLFDEAFARSTYPLNEVFTLVEPTSAAAAAAHARALSKSGQHDQAYSVVCQVALGGGTQFLRWTETWPLPTADGLRRCLAGFFNSASESAAQLALAGFVTRAVEAHPDASDIVAMSSVVARKGGDPNTARIWAKQSIAIDETQLALGSLAAACRVMNDWDEANAAWNRQTQLEPQSPYPWLDWADAMLDRGELDAASTRYNEAIARDPKNAWAHGSLAYVAYRRQPTSRAWTALRAWSSANPNNQRAANLLHESTPWVGWLPNPTEVNFNAWSSIRSERELTELTGLKMTTSHLEGPSVLYAMACFIDGYTCQVETIQSPDPRTPLFGNYPLWHWDEVRPRPALSPAPREVQRIVHQLASQRYDATQWLTMGRQLMIELGQINTQELLACALHPTPPPPGTDELAWFWRCQHAVAFLLASIPTTSPSDGSIQALDAMLAVRQDWTGSAAIAALIAISSTNPELHNHVWARCYEVLYAGPNGGDFPTARAAYWGLLRLDPSNQAGVADQACAWLDG